MQPHVQPRVRQANLRAVLQRIHYGPAAPSRAELAKATGLTRATVSNLVEQLSRAGLVLEHEPDYHGGSGRPATPLSIRPGVVGGLGLEINTDDMGARVLDLSGDVVAEEHVRGPNKGSDPLAAAAALADLASRVVAAPAVRGLRLLGACVSIPGPVAEDSHTVMWAPNLDWREVDLATLLGASSVFRGLPVSVVNNADLAARAEAWLRRRAGRSGELNFLHVSVDEGVGAGLVRDGELYRGVHGWGIELGHVCVDPSGPLCRCGARGCLEQYAGTHALVEAAGLQPGATIPQVARAARTGDATAAAAVERATDALAIALGNAVNLLDVSDVVLGGVLRPLAAQVGGEVQARLAERVLMRGWSEVRVTAALGDERSSLTGAAVTVLGDAVYDVERLLASIADG